MHNVTCVTRQVTITTAHIQYLTSKVVITTLSYITETVSYVLQSRLSLEHSLLLLIVANLISEIITEFNYKHVPQRNVYAHQHYRTIMLLNLGQKTAKG